MAQWPYGFASSLGVTGRRREEGGKDTPGYLCLFVWMFAFPFFFCFFFFFKFGVMGAGVDRVG